jgi:hypothetical protein
MAINLPQVSITYTVATNGALYYSNIATNNYITGSISTITKGYSSKMTQKEKIEKALENLEKRKQYNWSKGEQTHSLLESATRPGSTMTL